MVKKRWHVAAFLAASVVQVLVVGLGSWPEDMAAEISSSMPGRVDVAAPAAEPSSAAAPPASAPRAAEAPRLPRSFGNAKDVWAYANAALQSDSEAVVHEGLMAARECKGFAGMWDEYGSFAAGATNTSVFGPLTPERQLAIQALGGKCAGFISAGKSSERALVKALAAKEAQLGGRLQEAEKQVSAVPKNAEAVARLLFSESPSAVDVGLTHLSQLWAEAHRLAESDPSVMHMDLAVMLAGCDLGNDCGPDAYRTQLRCALQGHCGDSLWGDWTEGLTPAEVEGVLRLRALVRGAVSSGDLSGLGIRAPTKP